MRRLKATTERERGGVAVIVAIVMVVMLGFAALAIDVAKLYSERAQLQNGSDAVALGVARRCASVTPSDTCAAVSVDIQNLANGNAVDGQTTVQPIVLDKLNRTVTATTTAKENGSSPNTVSLFFARALGFDSAKVTATSSVAWGSPVKGNVPFPLAFSVCQVSGMVGTGNQLLQSHDPSAKTNKGTPGCTYAGQPVPGGFSWITQTPGICGSSIDLSTSVSYSNTGNDAPSNCASTVQGWRDSILAGKEVVVLLPVFDQASETGSSGYYHLTSFAAFKVRGWKLASGNGTNASLIFRNTKADLGNDATLDCTGDCRGIIGSFVNYVSLADGYTLGPISPNGAAVVELIR